MTDLPERAKRPDPSALRASDADRDRVAQVLRDAAGEGRLGLDELDERLDAVYTAKTYAELEPITRDLPTSTGESAPAPMALGPGGLPPSKLGLGILSGFTRRGGWTAGERFTAISFWGGGTIDLRETHFTGPELRIRAFAVMGGVEIIAPEDMDVHVKGIGIMGGFEDKASGRGAPGRPRVIVSGFAFWGGVSTKRKPRRRDKKLRLRLDRGDD